MTGSEFKRMESAAQSLRDGSRLEVHSEDAVEVILENGIMPFPNSGSVQYDASTISVPKGWLVFRNDRFEMALSISGSLIAELRSAELEDLGYGDQALEARIPRKLIAPLLSAAKRYGVGEDFHRLAIVGVVVIATEEVRRSTFAVPLSAEGVML